MGRTRDRRSVYMITRSRSASGTSVGSDPTLVGSDDNAEEILLKHIDKS